MTVPKPVADAILIAQGARANAHAPYSKFRVGAALKLKDHADAVPGCNVENASYGATVCAERTAIQTAVARYGRFSPEFVVVVTGGEVASPPCALCLQVLAEFAGDETQIYLANAAGEVQSSYALGTLLPHPFRSFTPEGRKA